MKSYWDLTKRERLSLTQDQVDSVYAVREAAIQGVLKPVKPELVPVPEAPNADHPVPEHFFKAVGKKDGSRYSSNYEFSAVFTSIEDAKAFIAMRPRYADSTYKNDSRYDLARTPISYEIEMVAVHNEDALTEFFSIMADYNKAVSENSSLMSSYNSALTKYNNCSAKIRKDYAALNAHREKLKNIITNLDEFVHVCEGNFLMACKCILKTVEPQLLYDALSEIPHTYEWLTVEIFGGVCLAEDNDPYRDISANSL